MKKKLVISLIFFSSKGFSSALFFALGLTCCLVSCGGKTDTNSEFVSQVSKNIAAEIGATLDDSLVSHFVTDIKQFFETHKIPQSKHNIEHYIRYQEEFDFRDLGKKDLILKLYILETLERNIDFQNMISGKEEDDIEVPWKRIEEHLALIERMKKIREELKNEIEADAGMSIDELKKELEQEKRKNMQKQQQNLKV